MLLHSVDFQNAYSVEQSGYTGSINYAGNTVNIEGKKFSDVFSSMPVQNTTQTQSRNLSPEQKKNYDYNQNNTTPGTKLYTLQGIPVDRYTRNVGKFVSGQLYFHKNYASEVVPAETLSKAEKLLKENDPNFS